MDTCSTCRHWTRKQAANGVSPLAWAGTCGHPALGMDMEGNPLPPDGLRFEDYADHGNFETGEGFGCIHHEWGRMIFAPCGVKQPGTDSAAPEGCQTEA